MYISMYGSILLLYYWPTDSYGIYFIKVEHLLLTSEKFKSSANKGILYKQELMQFACEQQLCLLQLFMKSLQTAFMFLLGYKLLTM